MSLSSDKLPIGFLTVQSRQAATLGGGRQVGNQTKNYRAKAHGLGHALCVHQFHMSTRTYTSVLKSQEKTLTIQRRSPGFRELIPLVCLLNLSAPLTSCLCLAGGKECEVQRRWGTAADRPSHLCAAVALPPSHTASPEGPQKIHSLETLLAEIVSHGCPGGPPHLVPSVLYPCWSRSSETLSLCSTTEFQAPKEPRLLRDKQTRPCAKSWETKAENSRGTGGSEPIEK